MYRLGACEAHIDSTLTKLIFRYAFNKPGFITDPVFDVSKNALIHFHCTAPTRMDARKMPANWCAGVDIEGGIVEELHRVVFYGDHLQSIKDLSVLMGPKVVEEV